MASAGPCPAVLAAERATLLQARRHLERGLRALEAEEQALLRWVPGQPLPMPDAVPEEGVLEDDEEWEAGSAAEAGASDARNNTSNASGVEQLVLAALSTTADADKASDRESGSDWEEDLMEQLPGDSAWLREQPPSVLGTAQLASDG
jgi:hypothetical protein